MQDDSPADAVAPLVPRQSVDWGLWPAAFWLIFFLSAMAVTDPNGRAFVPLLFQVGVCVAVGAFVLALRFPSVWPAVLVGLLLLMVEAVDNGLIIVCGLSLALALALELMPMVRSSGRPRVVAHVPVLLAMACSLAFVSPDFRDARSAWAWATRHEPRHVGSFDDLMAHPPRPGEWVAVQGWGRCAVLAPDDDGLDCSTVRWSPRLVPLPSTFEGGPAVPDLAALMRVGPTLVGAARKGQPLYADRLLNPDELSRALDVFCEARPASLPGFGDQCLSLKRRMAQDLLKGRMDAENYFGAFQHWRDTLHAQHLAREIAQTMPAGPRVDVVGTGLRPVATGPDPAVRVKALQHHAMTGLHFQASGIVVEWHSSTDRAESARLALDTQAAPKAVRLTREQRMLGFLAMALVAWHAMAFLWGVLQLSRDRARAAAR